MNTRVGPRLAFLQNLQEKYVHTPLVIPVYLFIDNVSMSVNNEKLRDISLNEFIERLHKALVNIQPSKIYVNGFDELDNLINTLRNQPNLPSNILLAFQHIITLPVNHRYLKLGILDTKSVYTKYYIDCLKKASMRLADSLINTMMQNLVVPPPTMIQQPVASVLPAATPRLPGIQTILSTVPLTNPTQAQPNLFQRPTVYPSPQTVQAPNFAPLPASVANAAPPQRVQPKSSAQSVAAPVKFVERQTVVSKPKQKKAQATNSESMQASRNDLMINVSGLSQSFLNGATKRAREENLNVDNGQANEVIKERPTKIARTVVEPELKPVELSEKNEDLQDPFASFSNDLFQAQDFDFSNQTDLMLGNEDSYYRPTTPTSNYFSLFPDFGEIENGFDQSNFSPKNNG